MDKDLWVPEGAMLWKEGGRELIEALANEAFPKSLDEVVYGEYDLWSEHEYLGVGVWGKVRQWSPRPFGSAYGLWCEGVEYVDPVRRCVVVRARDQRSVSSVTHDLRDVVMQVVRIVVGPLREVVMRHAAHRTKLQPRVVDVETARSVIRRESRPLPFVVPPELLQEIPLALHPSLEVFASGKKIASREQTALRRAVVAPEERLSKPQRRLFELRKAGAIIEPGLCEALVLDTVSRW